LQKLATIKNEKLVYGILGMLWLAYFVTRAYYVPFTFDEAATFFHFVHRGDFWFFTSLPDANNHFINTALTYTSYNTLGSSKLALRLPNLLSAFVFLYYLYRISQVIRNVNIRWMFILSIMFAHYFVEFFAVSRGYGLSMAFLFGAFFHLIRFVSLQTIRDILLISLFLILAEFSNLSIIVLVLAIIGYQILIVLFNPNQLSRKKATKIFLITAMQIIPVIFASYYMFYLQEKGSLYYGDSSGFWDLTVQSLILFVAGKKTLMLSLSVISAFIIQIVIISIIYFKKGLVHLFDKKLVLSMLLFSTIIGVLLLSVLFGVNHPEDRVAMYFIPLFLGSIFFMADELIDMTKKKWISYNC